jgi:hypothetical protein
MITLILLILSLGFNFLQRRKNKRIRTTLTNERAKRIEAQSQLSKWKSDTGYYKKQFEQLKFGKSAG